MRLLTGLLGAVAMVVFANMPATAQQMDMEEIKASAAKAEDFPSGPIDFVCTTSPGSSVAAWCQNLARGFSEELGVPVEVQFKSGGSQHEPVVYVADKPADGHTMMHVSASFYGYFHLPHYTKTYDDDFQFIAEVENHTYGIGVAKDNKWGIETYEDLVRVAKENCGELSMGSNKIGSSHHRQQVGFLEAAGIGECVNFVPYQGDGDVVKDILGGHLDVGHASPRTWRPHLQAGTAIPLVMLTAERLDDPDWKDVRTVSEVGLDYVVPYHWQGLAVKKGTPEPVMDKLILALHNMYERDFFKEYLANGTHIQLDIRDDRDWINEDMEKNQAAVKEFMIENKMIEPDA
jgi:tripartite-type tricarboxylate transporter receptor subunit TctC